MNRVFGIAVLVGLAACGAENLPPVEADVLVVGGTAKGVAAAVAAKAEGADVFLVTPFTYLGEDMAGTLELGLPDGPGGVRLLAGQEVSASALDLQERLVGATFGVQPTAQSVRFRVLRLGRLLQVRPAHPRKGAARGGDRVRAPDARGRWRDGARHRHVPRRPARRRVVRTCELRACVQRGGRRTTSSSRASGSTWRIRKAPSRRRRRSR